jgi:hypothetical protein
MSFSIQQFIKDYGFLIICVVVVILILRHFGNKSSSGYESNQSMQKQYTHSNASGSVAPANPEGQNEVFASANGMETSMPGLPSTCKNTSITNPAELLPKDSNNQWAQLNPNGKGELANVNLLKAGYHIGIDTIGQTLRNANQQIRSEPPNPQLYVGPWNQSTIEPDFMRVPLEIGQGGQ